MKGAFLVRLIIATSLYTIMGRATVWFDPISNAILVFGSRFFLVFSSFFFSRLQANAIPAATLLAALGSALILLPNQVFFVIGATCLAIGVSVAGYLIRAYASENIGAAAQNKIAINCGVILAGITLSLPIQNNTTIALISFVFLLIASYVARHIVASRTHIELPAGKNVSRPIRLAWVLLGLTMGIKLYAPFTLLPQYIVSTLGSLTQWYGLVVLASSVFIVAFQKVVIHIIGKFASDRAAMIITWATMLCGLCVIASLGVFHVETLAGALAWVLILSLIECFASYLDVFGARDNCLFIKELSVGAGGGLGALISRYFPVEISGQILALTGITFLIIAAVLFLNTKTDYSAQGRRHDAN